MPDIQWVPSPNFYPNRIDKQGVQHKPLVIVDHIECGTERGTDSWFHNPDSQVSANFSVARDGSIHCHVRLQDGAWTNGALIQPDVEWLKKFPSVNPNYWTVSIEHEGYPGDGLTEAQYQSTLWLHKWILSQCPEILPDSDHIVGHFRFDSVTRKNCPGPKFPWDRLFADLNPQKPSTNGDDDVQVPTLKIGVTGHDDAVKAIQAIVGATPDGDFGTVTTRKVKTWQKAHGLLDDGVVGPKTWATMLR